MIYWEINFLFPLNEVMVDELFKNRGSFRFKRF